MKVQDNNLVMLTIFLYFRKSKPVEKYEKFLFKQKALFFSDDIQFFAFLHYLFRFRVEVEK